MTLYQIFSFLDYGIYSIVKYVVRLILLIANYDFFGPDVIKDISQKVYVVLGVLVLFKIVIACIQYMINPDVFDDKDKGMAGILKKTILCIGMLALVQPIFEFAIKIQGTIVSTIPGIVLGNDGTNYIMTEHNSKDIKEEIDGIGDLVAGSTIWSFVTLKDKATNPDAKFDVEAIKDGKKTGVKIEEWDKKANKTIDDFRENIIAGCDSGFLNINLDTKTCAYDYRILISTAAGLFLLYILISMTLDVGIRAIKLGLLQILAPIPIGSYVMSKDKFDKFVKIAVKVYLDLFVRLGVIYFIIFFVQKVVIAITEDNISIANGSYSPDSIDVVFIKVVIIIALFMFAKNAPKFICDALGIDGGGFGDMKDMFTRGGGMAGAALNPATNAIANWRQAKANGENVGHRLRRAAAGAGRGVADSLAGLAAGDNWQKMRARHDKAVKKSGERSLARVNRIKNKDQAAEKKNAFSNMIQNLKDRKNKFVNDADRAKAKENLIKDKDRMTQLANELASGSLSEEERKAKLQEYSALKSRTANEEKYLKEEAVRVAAQRQVEAKAKPYRDQIKNANSQIAQIDQQLKAGGLSATQRADLEAKKLDLQNQITSAEDKIAGIMPAAAKAQLDAATAKRQAVETNINSVTAQRNSAQTAITNAQAEIASNNAAIANIDALLAKETAGTARHAALAKQKQDLIANNTIQSSIVRTKTSEVQGYEATIANLNQQKEAAVAVEQRATVKYETTQATYASDIQNLVEEYEGIDKQIADYEGEINKIDVSQQAAKESIRAARFSGVNSYLGGATPSGKGYLDLSSFLGSSRSSIYTGEAMTKMRQNADILVDLNGNPVTYSTKFCAIPNRKYSYEEMRSLLNDVQTSKINIETLQRDYGFQSSAALQSAFEDVEKKAAADYINANIAQINSDVRDKVNVRLKRPEALNSAVVEWYDDFVADLYKNGASKKDLDELRKMFSKDPGDFIKNASALKDKYASIGKKIVDAQKPSDGGKK